MTEETYDDDLTSHLDCANLWQEVLSLAVNDAVHGVKMAGSFDKARARLTQEARDYVMVPNADFDEVCRLAGIEPEAVREHVAPKIAAAPSPEELANEKTPPHRQKGRRTYAFNGKTLTMGEWARECGLPFPVLQQRFAKGWPIERALTEPVWHSKQREARPCRGG